jgi:hypothetical protein
VNSVATFQRAFISLDKKIASSLTQIIIGLQSFAQIKTSGFSLSITAIA